MNEDKPPFHVALAAGAIAGVSVDASLFPIDTVKTRLQSSQGFWKTGGFRGIYSGILPAFLGSAPSAALFFTTYEAAKSVGNTYVPQQYDSLVHMAAASCGEVMACLIRVPTEVVKQRAQATRQASSGIFLHALQGEGVTGLYRGYFVTLLREIPFSLIQFPLWEFTKKMWGGHRGRPVDAWQSAVCGSFAGGIAAAVTTPLDVMKTRIMLASKDSSLGRGVVSKVAGDIIREKGLRGLFAGVVPRVMWISIGGFVFLGMYEKSKIVMLRFQNQRLTYSKET
nr:S-adenosylmethionine mitochondrial carrier protein-like [Lytechinus pictus]